MKTGPWTARNLVIAFFAAAAPMMLGGCGRSPEEIARVEEHERQIGEEQHQMLLTQFGGTYDGPEAAYLKNVGQKLAAAAGLAGECRFTLVNTDVVNAFAVPGCYIYVTRGLMALMNSEAELAGVLGHELGHIVADHSEERQKRSLLRQLGLLAVALATESEMLTRIAGGAAELFTLRYSRKHENEADEFAVKNLIAAGYDPYAAADALEALGRHEQFSDQGGGPDIHSIPEWGRTHPLAENRVERVRAAAQAAGLRDDELPEEETAFLNEIDGLLYGDDPQQGFVLGRRFAHPEMRIAFEVPQGFQLTNTSQAVLIDGPGGLRGEFSGGRLPQGGLDHYARDVVERVFGAKPDMSGGSRTMVNGVPTIVLPVRVGTPEGSLDAVVAAYAGPGRTAYHIIFVAPPGGRIPDEAGDLIGSFSRLSPGEAARLRPRVVDVIAVGEGDTPERIAATMATERPLKHFRMLNDLDEGEPLRPGERVKIVRFGSVEN